MRELVALDAIKNTNSEMSAVIATQVNPFHNTIDLFTEAGKKLC